MTCAANDGEKKDAETTEANKPEGDGGGGVDPTPEPEPPASGSGLSKNTIDLLLLLVATGGVKGSLAVVLGYFVGINALAQVRRLRLRKSLVSHTFSEPSLPILSPPFVC